MSKGLEVKKPKAVIYCRVSTKMQTGADHYSLGMQETACRRYADYHEIPVKGVFKDEGKSGTSMNGRASLQDALSSLRDGDYFLVYSITRLARSIRDGLEIIDYIKKEKCNFVSVTEQIDTSTASGQLQLNIMLAMGQFEAESTREKIKDALEERKRSGKFIGRIPYGFMDDGYGTLIKHPENYPLVEYLVKLIDDDDMSYGRVSLTLNEEERKRKDKYGTAIPWWPSSVKSVYESFKKIKI